MADAPSNSFDPLAGVRNLFGGIRDFGDNLWGAIAGPPPRVSPGGAPLPPEQLIQEFIVSTLQNPYLTDEQRSDLINGVQYAPETLGEQQNRRQQFENARKAADAAAETEAQQRATQQRALEDLGNLESKGNLFYDTQIGRFADPNGGNGVRSDLFSVDRSFGNAIASGDSAINANIQRVRNNAVLSQAGTGSNFSGKATTAVGNAENAGAGQRAANRSTLFGQAENALTGLRQGQLDFQENVNRQRTNINSGLAPDLTGLTSFAAPQINYTLPYQQQFGEAQTQFGKNLATAGLFLDAAGAATNTGVNAANLFINGAKGGGG